MPGHPAVLKPERILEELDELFLTAAYVRAPPQCYVRAEADSTGTETVFVRGAKTRWAGGRWTKQAGDQRFHNHSPLDFEKLM